MFQHQHLSIKKTVHVSCSFTSLSCLTEKKIHVAMACHYFLISYRSCRGRDRMVVGFTTTYRYAIGAHQHESGEFESRSRQCELDTTLCDKFVNDLHRSVFFSSFLHQ